MKKQNHKLCIAIAISAFISAQAAETIVFDREKPSAKRPTRPDRPSKPGAANYSEMKELRALLEQKRKSLPKTPEVLQSEQRAIIRERLRPNPAPTGRASALNKKPKKEPTRSPHEQSRKVAIESEAPASEGRKRD